MSKLKRIARNMSKLDGLQIKVGVLRNAGSYPDGTKVVDVAVWNELGEGNMPPRAFIGDTFRVQRTEIRKIKAELVRRVMLGTMSVSTVAQATGNWYKGIVQRSITNTAWAPNAPMTIARKGSSKPLVDTGRLLNSIDWERV